MRKNAVKRPTNFQITVLMHDPRWKGLKPTVTRAAEAALQHQKVKKASVTLALANDKEIKALNYTYRGKNKPTNVLSFSDGETVEGLCQLGDVILSYDTVAREAELQGKSFKHHVTHLVIHGVLHLLGHDHEDIRQAKRMETIEIATLARMGIANPYESA